jgi:hypothetical protein
MRITRLVAATVTTGLLGLVPVTLAPAANAATPVTVTVQPNYKALTYGTKASVVVAVQANGSSLYTGNVTLQRRLNKGAWKAVGTQTSGGYKVFEVKPQQNTQFRAVYSDSTGAYESATSGTKTIKVARKITGKIKSKTFVTSGKVTPKYGKKKIVISVSKKQNKGFKKFKTIKTNKKGKYTFKLPKRKGTWYWRYTVKKDKKFIANWTGYRTWVY